MMRVFRSVSSILFLCCFITALNSSAAYAVSMPAQDVDKREEKSLEVGVLERGAVIEREIGGGECHYYKLKLASGDFLRVVVEQKGIDLMLALFGPDNVKSVETDRMSRGGTQGNEYLLFLADTSGDYRLRIGAS